jgi:peptide/nickel transport system ATP-binding protein
MAELLKVQDLKTYFHTDHGLVKAVDGVSFHLNEHEIISIVGESGCGKSVSQMSAIQLIQTPPGQIAGGTITFEGKNLLDYDANSAEIRSIRGGKIGMIFQEPMTSLNPVLTIGQQLTEGLRLHMHLDKDAARKRAGELLRLVGISGGERRLDDYPHQFSGGMRQRVMIAMALSCNPRILIADEPTTAVDVTTQAQLMELLKDMVDEFNSSLIIVTHNLGLVARYAARIYVMYAGRIVESGTTKELFGNPRHPYTKGLLACVPRLDEPKGKKLVPIDGLPPDLVDMSGHCAFLPRCKYAIDRCKHDPWPALIHEGGQHYYACYADTREKKK